ncbi:MobF family relaxase [Pseudonocardia nigra]|uniref:MobF family relaxase n=1 Tax=Pseudonocardia nigra TaxID=1921578 RepID=UPI001C5F00DF|nr:MobF family relaxase [Pseudonocardia nigra]
MLRMRTGHDTDYFHDAVAKGRDGYYTDASAAGEPPGLWYGRGAEALGLTGEVDAEIMKALYTHGLDPRDPAVGSRETWGKAARFGNPPRNYKPADEIYAALLEAYPEAGPEERAELRAQAARSARQSVAFYDIVLSASKSQTLLWVAAERGAREAAAAGDEQAAAEWRRVAGVVEEALMVGHRGVLDYLAEHATYARAGHHGGGGGQWVEGTGGLISAQFLQHDSRDKDPQLHVHGPTANKVECGDGKVRALDFTLFTQHHDAAAAYGERIGEAYLYQQLGVLWETRPNGKAREIAGIDPDAAGLFSKRTAAITPAVEELIARFRAETGRAPTKTERSGLVEQAASTTRRAKVFGAETRDGQLARWAAEYDAAFGREFPAMATAALGRAPAQPDLWSERDVISRALAEMEDSRQSWTRSNLMLAVSNALPGHLGVGPDHVQPLLEGLTDRALALAQHINPRTGPEGLDAKYYRSDGESVFVKPHSQRYATQTQILGEDELRAAAVRRGAPIWSTEDADEVIARFARAGRELGADQAAALRGILTSGAAVEVLNAPAGTGKSFLVGALADTWPLTGTVPTHPVGGGDPGADPGSGAGDGPRVFGVAYGQRQADVLSEEGVKSLNIRRWLDGQARLDDGHGTAEDEAFRLRSGDLLVVDEAGAAATPDLVAIHRRCETAGAKLLLVGDHKQLGSVGAGGALADIAERGITYELAEVRRFTEGWEASASLRLRDGDTAVAAEYAKHGRLVDAGTAEQAEQAAARAWLADTIDGRDALLVVGSNAAAARVSNQLRADLVRLGRVAETGVPLEAPGWEGSVAGVGDLIQARRNAWHLEGWRGNTEAPINRQTYRVTAVAPDGGGLTVARVTGRNDDGAERLAEPLQLPTSYVRERVTLAYASTVHAAHGRTVGHGYGVLTPGTDAAAAYVQATRGRDGNTLFVVTRHVADTAEVGETQKAIRRSPAEVLADVIRPPEHDPNRTALTEAETAAERARATATHADPLIAVIGDMTVGRTGRWLDQLAAADTLPEHHRVALAADEARTSLDQLLRSAELAGHDPTQVLRDAVTSSSLDGSTSVAQVLHFRIRTALEGKLDPQVSSFADLLPRDLDEHDRAGLEALAAAADSRRNELGAQLAEKPPAWAREALGPVPDAADDPVGRAEWEHKAGWAASYREWADHTDDADPLGAAPPAGLAEKHAVFRAAHAALELSTAGAEEEAMSEGRLRARVAAWEREQRFAPRFVADQLEAAHEALRGARTDATVWAARADAETDPLEADQLRAAAEEARQRAEELAPVVADLEFADDTRTAWRYETEVTRDKAERARYAAGLRGINLDDPGERVTAEEWLDAHLAEQLAADADRAITEHDLDPRHDSDQPEHTDARDNIDQPNHDQLPDAGRDEEGDQSGRYTDRGNDDDAHDDHGRGDGGRHDEVVIEPAPPDIRETSVPDAGERVDPQHRRRIPLPDEAAATVDRAQLALDEIKARRDAEAAEQAHAAESPPDEEERRDELNRWDEQDRADVDASAASSDATADVLDQAHR